MRPAALALATLCACAARPQRNDATSAAAAEPSLEVLREPAAVAALAHPSKPTLVHFWALWCPGCVDELPAMIELAARARAAGAEVVFVNLDGLSRAADVRAQLDALRGFGGARQLQLDTALDVDAVTRPFDPGWHGALPATFAITPGRRTLGIARATSALERDALLAALR